jgi:uncharacterized protein YbjT (DUF2867 family)
MYVVTGATGHTGKIIAHNLLDAGKPVRVVVRNAEKAAEFAAKGAEVAVGDLTDAAFLTTAFAGATAAYLLIPPKFDLTTDWSTYQKNVGDALIAGLRANGVKKAVLLSSHGAHLLQGAGPVSGIGRFEQDLRSVEGLSVRSLRAGYFMENLFASVGMIQHAGIYGASLKGDVPVPIVHTRDIAEAATRRLLALDFAGHTHEFVSGAADLTFREVTSTIGRAIGKPELPYVEFSPADAKAGMLQAGLPETIADGYLELFDALNNGTFTNDYTRTPASTTPTTFQHFVDTELKFAFAGN